MIFSETFYSQSENLYNIFHNKIELFPPQNTNYLSTQKRFFKDLKIGNTYILPKR